MNGEVAQPEYQFRKLRNQYFAAIVGNIIFTSHGLMIGWTSPALPYLSKEDSPLKTGPLTSEQIGWIGSINGLSAIFGAFLFGLTSSRIGPKRTMILLSIPATMFWILIHFGDTYHHLLFARVCTGLVASGVQTAIPLFIANVAANDVRGRLGSVSHLSRNVGILTMFIIGAFVHYKTLPYIFFSVPIIFGIGFSLFPNTPQFHLSREQDKEALASVKFYKSCDGKTTTEIMAIGMEFERLKAIAEERTMDEKIRLTDIFNKKSMESILNGIILANLSHLSGFLVFITYAALIFEKVGASKIDPSILSISLAVMQLIGTCCTTKFVDSLGRKALMIISLLGSSFGMFSFSLYSYLRKTGHDLSSFEWVPVCSLSFVIFVSSSGIVALVQTCTVESLPPKIRTVGLTIVNICHNCASFYCTMLFPILSDLIGLHGYMVIVASICCCGSLYVWIFLKETKGKTLDILEKSNESIKH